MISTLTQHAIAPAITPESTQSWAEGESPVCFHCGTLCRSPNFTLDDKHFCCNGCSTVFEILTASGLSDYYKLNETAGVRITAVTLKGQYRFLDEAAVRDRLVDFFDEKVTRVTFYIPSIHCIACVWLLENLFRLKPGIGQSQVNFPRKEASLSFDPSQVKLSEVVTMMASLGYEPELNLSSLDAKPKNRAARRLWIQIGIAGFAFGNIMLFSISDYLGLDAFAGAWFQRMVGGISLTLSLPVVIYSAADYWRAAWTSARQRLLNIDVPIAAGVVAIFLQSTYEVITGIGNGYFDSLCGLIFFLLCGKLFQQKSYDRLAFDRDYKSFFPLSVTRKRSNVGGQKSEVGEEQVSLSQIAVADRLSLRNGELIPADAKLIGGPALIDYSFVTGESEPVKKKAEDHLFAGGRQMGGTIEIETLKSVSQSYLTSLWNQDAFRNEKRELINQITHTYSHRFTQLVIAVAIGAGVFWAIVDPSFSLKSFTSVLIVACPCALALAAPFALGTAQRVLSGRNVFLKNPYVLETLATVDAVVFDKTGTLTAAGAGSATWKGAPLDKTEERWLFSVTRHSTHPLPVRIAESIKRDYFPDPVRSFVETPGCGMEGNVAGHEIWMGSALWLEGRDVNTESFSVRNDVPATRRTATGTKVGSVVHVAIDGNYRGHFILATQVREEANQLMAGLNGRVRVALLSGDNDHDRKRFTSLLGPKAELRFNQSPRAKLTFIKGLQSSGMTVMMVGDGLNDAGALQQADVGVAVVEKVNAFSPASNVILAAEMVTRLAEVLRYAKQSLLVVRTAFWISAVYNLVGVTIAASGKLSPVVCAVLMPVSSVTVVAFACGAATWFGRNLTTPPDKTGSKE